MKFSIPVLLNELAKLTGSIVVGNSDMEVKGINEIHKVENGDITFVDHPKYYEKALNSAATFIIINKDTIAPAGKALLISEDPFSAYITIVKKFRTFNASSERISSSAQIGNDCIIQPGVFAWMMTSFPISV